MIGLTPEQEHMAMMQDSPSYRVDAAVFYQRMRDLEPQATPPEERRNEWRDLAHEAFLQLEYLHQRERQHSSTGAVLLRLSEKLGFPLETTPLPQPERTPSPPRRT